MAAMHVANEIAPEDLRLMILAFGMDHAYRVISLEEVTQAMPHVRKDLIRKGLDQLAREGLVTKFAGRYCFNKPLARELRQTIERAITPSGTIRAKKTTRL